MRIKEKTVKIAVSSSGPSLEASVDPRFGRAPFFLLVDPETQDFEAVPNQPNLQAAQGAGIQAAALVARYKPEAILTGHCGPKAFHTLEAAGISVIVGVEGSVQEAVHDYRAGKFRPARGPNVTSHW
jgi:predicted Fe-Mo cluster-binding NifX family protein